MQKDILIQSRTHFVKNLASKLGFEFCGIAQAAPLYEDAKRLEQWLQKGFHGKMAYMERNFDLRIDPTKLVPGSKSVITLMLNYYSDAAPASSEAKVSKYAYGNDYHDVIREKLNVFLATLRHEVGDIDGRGFVDSAPVLERTWAQKTGLGWIGKNGNLINKQAGSFYFLATLITDLELTADSPFAKDYCGTCTKCLDACPTGAIKSPTVVDGAACISYLTIELKDEFLPEQFKGKMDNWMFGCDVCQDVCPWNRFAKPNTIPEFEPNEAVIRFSIKDWQDLEEQTFKTLFKHSPIKRTKWKGVQRNVNFLME